ncbi:MAG TPA: TlpA disulfide reductase family protein [Ktedonobacteraceae bacterium]|nr:TlpA disulfide reductase family protein [Ktedonobacteraceae bacterium]
MDTGETISGAGVIPPQKQNRKRGILIFTVVTIINIGLLALLCTQLLTPAQSGSSQSPGDPLLGKAAPNFALPALNGTDQHTISLADFKGKAVVINFWSSTCQPCKDEMPLLETQWERVQQQGIVFLGIDVEDTTSDGQAFLKEHGATYSSVIDTSGRTLVDYGVTYTPETIFIDRTGKVINAVRMEITSQQLQDNLQKLLHP